MISGIDIYHIYFFIRIVAWIYEQKNVQEEMDVVDADRTDAGDYLGWVYNKKKENQKAGEL